MEFIDKLTKSVFPFPGGPNNNKPLGGILKPVNHCYQ